MPRDEQLNTASPYFLRSSRARETVVFVPVFIFYDAMFIPEAFERSLSTPIARARSGRRSLTYPRQHRSIRACLKRRTRRPRLGILSRTSLFVLSSEDGCAGYVLEAVWVRYCHLLGQCGRVGVDDQCSELHRAELQLGTFRSLLIPCATHICGRIDVQ